MKGALTILRYPSHIFEAIKHLGCSLACLAHSLIMYVTVMETLTGRTDVPVLPCPAPFFWPGPTQLPATPSGAFCSLEAGLPGALGRATWGLLEARRSLVMMTSTTSTLQPPHRQTKLQPKDTIAYNDGTQTTPFQRHTRQQRAPDSPGARHRVGERVLARRLSLLP
jgi:hypothetical protein